MNIQKSLLRSGKSLASARCGSRIGRGSRGHSKIFRVSVGLVELTEMFAVFAANWRLYRRNTKLAVGAFSDAAIYSAYTILVSLVFVLAQLTPSKVPTILLSGACLLHITVFGYSLLNGALVMFPDLVSQHVRELLIGDARKGLPRLEEDEKSWLLYVGSHVYAWSNDSNRLVRDEKVLIEGLQDAFWHYVSEERVWRMEGTLLGRPLFIFLYEDFVKGLKVDGLPSTF